MMTIRSHDQFNTTVYGLNDRYRGVHGGRRVLFINAEDIAARGWKGGMRVGYHQSLRDGRAGGALVPVGALRGAAGMCGRLLSRGQRAGAIGSVAERSNTPTSKSIVVSLAASG